MSTTILGHQVSMPICISPTALHKMAHPDGEVATAKGCAKSQSLMIQSFYSSSKMEDVVNALGQAPRLQHLFIWNEKKEIVRRLIQEEERSGVKGFLITVDAAVRGKRRSYTTTTDFNYDLRSMNIFMPRFEEMFSKREEYTEEKTKKIGNGLTWDIISWVKSITKLPVILKGILTAEDAKLAVQHGADAIIVSNHGGRQLDGVLATIDALPEVVSAVNGQVEVYLDGGVRLGTDVLKALALGARAVFIGRPVLWGLACQGEEGVHKVLEILRTELKTAMILSGCSSLADIPASLVTKQCQCRL
ncbi:Hydroxyacid oxidase 1 [Exaiptasia diaphana]|nr:Hydroxyacid oxidase 1 [Exaiptasia diaphana]